LGALNVLAKPSNVLNPGKKPYALNPNALLTLPANVSLIKLNAINGGLCVINVGKILDTNPTLPKNPPLPPLPFKPYPQLPYTNFLI